MPAIASLEDLKSAQREGVSIYAMRFALCCMKMAAHRLEKYLQAVASGTHSGRIERRRGAVNKVDQALLGFLHMRKPLGKCAKQDIRNNGWGK